jgi:CRISPR-associated protein Cas1
MLEGVKNAENPESLRGYEGAAARYYYGQIRTCVAPFVFEKRVYHPPDCPVNAMLSFGYTLLYNRLAAVLRDKGFNPAKGFFHVERGRHMALSSDLLETLRHVAERIVLSLIHKHQIDELDFTLTTQNERPVCHVSGESFRVMIRSYEKTMATTFTFEGRKTTWNNYLDEMADMLKRTLSLGTPFNPLVLK